MAIVFVWGPLYPLHGSRAFEISYGSAESNLNMRQRRWLDVVKDYDCEILYHPGKENVVVDALSQNLASSFVVSLFDLGGLGRGS